MDNSDRHFIRRYPSEYGPNTKSSLAEEFDRNNRPIRSEYTLQSSRARAELDALQDESFGKRNRIPVMVAPRNRQEFGIFPHPRGANDGSNNRIPGPFGQLLLSSPFQMAESKLADAVPLAMNSGHSFQYNISQPFQMLEDPSSLHPVYNQQFQPHALSQSISTRIMMPSSSYSPSVPVPNDGKQNNGHEDTTNVCLTQTAPLRENTNAMWSSSHADRGGPLLPPIPDTLSAAIFNSTEV